MAESHHVVLIAGSIERGSSKGSHALMLRWMLGRSLNMEVVWHGELTFVTAQSWSLRVLFQFLGGLHACKHLRVCDELRGVLTYVKLSLEYSSTVSAVRLHCNRSVYLQLIDAPIHIDVLHYFFKSRSTAFVLLACA